MFRGTLVCCVLTFLRVSTACYIPEFNFTISSLKNETGHWYAEVRLNHESEHPWDVYVDRTTVQINGEESVAIVAKLIPLSIEQKKITCPTSKQLFIYGYEETPEMGYYKFHKVNYNWQEAVDACEKEGAHLVILNSIQEAIVVEKIIRQKSSKYLYHWIGIHDNYEEGQYLTVFNQTLQSTGYTKWYNGNPKGGPQYNCLAYVCNPLKCGYDDWACDHKRPFICEHEYVA